MDTASVLTQQGSAILLIPLIVEWMKKTNWPLFNWIDCNTDTINRTVSWGMGIVAAVGIHWVADCQAGVCSASIDFTHFDLGGLFHDTAAVGVQLGGQQLMYKALRLTDAMDTWLKAQNEKPRA